MALNIQSVNYLSGVTSENTVNNSASGQVQINVAGGLNSKEAGLALLANLSAGDTFTGEIINITPSEITLALSDQVTINAQLADALSYNIGDMATFSVKENSNDVIVLKSINSENLKNLMNDQTIHSALRSAGLVIDETNVSLVHNMMKQGISIDSNTLSSYASKLGTTANATPEDVVMLSKMGIEINETNVNALHNFYNFNDGIMEQGNQLMKGFSEAIINTAASMEFTQTDVAELINNYTEVFNSSEMTPGTNAELSQTIPQEQLTQLAENILNLEEGVDLGITNNANAEGEVAVNINTQSSTQFMELAAKAANGSITPKEFLTQLANLLDNEIVSPKDLETLVKSNGFKAVTDNFTAGQMYIPPEDFEKESVKKMYAKILNDSNAIKEKFGADSRFTTLTGAANQLSQNIELMNNINQFMSFVQVPLKLAGQNTHGDLYVYSKKGGGHEEGDDLKALLHLDMDNLGPLDVLVTLNKNKVATDFKVESAEILDFIEAHMDELSAALQRLGYNAEVTASLNTTPYSFKKSVVESELPPVEIKRFSFDVRA